MSRHVRRGPPKVFIWVRYPLQKNETKIDVSKDVMAFKVSKALGQPTGSFSITLLPRQRNGSNVANLRAPDLYYRSIRPNSLVSIGFEEKGGIMLGMVDRVARTRNMSGPQGGQTIVITGRDIGKFLVNDNIIKSMMSAKSFGIYEPEITAALGPDHPILLDLLGVWAPRNKTGEPTFVGVGLDKVVQFILEQTPSMKVPVLSELGTKTPAEFIGENSIFTVTPLDDDQVFKDKAKSYQGNIWNFIWSSLDADLYEMWIDSVPDDSQPAFARPLLILRPKPFDEPGLQFAETKENLKFDWKGLTTLVESKTHHEILEDEILQESLGFDDSQSYSYYQITSQHDLMGSPEGEQMGLAFPLIDFHNARNYGLKAYNTRLVNAGADVTSNREDPKGYEQKTRLRVQEVRNRLFNWYRLNPYFETGSITVPGRDSFRIGDPVFLPHQWGPVGEGRGMRYYCTHVEWSWTFGGHYTSTLGLTRGHNDTMLDQLGLEIAAEGASYIPPNPDNFVKV